MANPSSPLVLFQHPGLSPDGHSAVSSSLPTSADSSGASAGLRDPRKNPIFSIVNDFYAKQQQEYMAKRARQQMQASKSDTSSHASIDAAAASPSSSAAAAAQAPERLFEWGETRDAAVARAREELDASIARSHVFQPNLEKVRFENTPRSTDASYIAVPESANTSYNEQSISERLFEDSKQSDQRLHEMRQLRNDQMRQECTFNPQTNIRRSDADLPSKVHESTAALKLRLSDSDYRRVEEEAEVARECTFHPAITENSRRIFESSRLDDGQQDVYSRLYARSIASQFVSNPPPGSQRSKGKHSSPRQASPTNGQAAAVHPPVPSLQPLIDEHVYYELMVLRHHFRGRQEAADCHPAATFFSNLLGDTPHRVETTFSSGTDQHAAEAAPTNTQQHQVLGSGTRRPFNNFLLRQSNAHDDRQRRLNALIEKLAPTHMPRTCDRSTQLVTAAKRSGSQPSRGRPTYEDPCTFRPVITKAGDNASFRGVDDMHLDGRRRQEKVDEKFKAKEAKFMEGYTFHPQIIKKAHVESMLKVSNLDRYQEHIAETRALMERRKKEMDDAALDLESAECTFRPQTNRTPSYISRMATSFAIVRDCDLSM